MIMNYTFTCYIFKYFNELLTFYYKQINYIFTFHSVPSGPPLNVMADTSSTSTTLRWDPPTERDRNGEITGYVVKYKLTTSTSYINEQILQGSENSYTITDLMQSNEYNISVSAMTVNGTGPNATIIITTVPIGKRFEDMYICM